MHRDTNAEMTDHSIEFSIPQNMHSKIHVRTVQPPSMPLLCDTAANRMCKEKVDEHMYCTTVNGTMFVWYGVCWKCFGSMRMRCTKDEMACLVSVLACVLMYFTTLRILARGKERFLFF